LYIVALLITAWVLVAQWYNLSSQGAYDYVDDMIQSYRDRTSQARDTIVTQEDPEDIFQEQEDTSDIFVIGLDDDEEDMVDEEPTQDTVWVATGDINQWEEIQNPDEQVTFTQALEHIFARYDVELSTATNTRFANIASTDPNYPLFKTAHERSLLGANIDPNALVRCDVYMVMKGIIAGRPLGNQADVFDKYRAAAQANDEINGCTRDGMVRVGNL